MASQQPTTEEILDPRIAVPSLSTQGVGSLASTKVEDTADSQFLLTEFTVLSEAWRHTDSRIDSSMNFYLTFGAVVLPVLVLLYQAISDIRMMVLASLPIAAALILLGIYLESRVTSTDKTKAGYVLGMQLIRRYYVDRYPHIGSYLYLPKAEPPLKGMDEARQALTYYDSGLALVLAIVNSTLVGAIVTGTIWLSIGQPVAAWEVLLGVIAGVVSLITFAHSYTKRTGIPLKWRSAKT